MKRFIITFALLSFCLIFISCGVLFPFWRPDTTCYPQMISQDQATSIKHLTSSCDYYNYGYKQYVKNKDKPKRFGFLYLFMESQQDYKIKTKNIRLNTNKMNIKESYGLFGLSGSIYIYKGNNMISIPINTCYFSNDTINIVITSNEGDTLMNSYILADESFSKPFSLLGTDTTYIDSVWYECVRNLDIHGKLSKHSSLERKAMEFSMGINK